MAMHCCACDQSSPVPDVLCDPAGRGAVRRSAVGVRSLGPLIGAACAIWSPVEHAAGFSDRTPAMLLCVAGVTRLIRRLRRPRVRWNATPGAPGRDRPGAY
jgi:hypothetical protein